MKLLLILFFLPFCALSQELQDVYDQYNNGQPDSAYQILKANEDQFMAVSQDETVYLFTKIGWVLYTEDPYVNSPERILAINYAKVLMESQDSIYQMQGEILMINLLNSLLEDMKTVVHDYSSSMNRNKLYMSDFCNELIPKIPLLAEYGLLDDAELVFDFSVIFNAEADELLAETENEHDDRWVYAAEETAAILYVSAFRLMSSACAIESVCCQMDGSKLSDEQDLGSKASGPSKAKIAQDKAER